MKEDYKNIRQKIELETLWAYFSLFAFDHALRY